MLNKNLFMNELVIRVGVFGLKQKGILQNRRVGNREWDEM